MTLSTNQIATELKNDTCARWSWDGAFALAEYLEELEDSTGEEMEFDPVAIRCDFSEHDSLQEWAADYFGTPLAEWADDIGTDADADDDTLDEKIREYLQVRGQLIEFPGGIIVSNF